MYETGDGVPQDYRTAVKWYGRAAEQGELKDGREEGPWVGYKKDGTVWELMTGTYKNGVRISD